MSRLPANLVLSLRLVQAVATITLARSVILERWTTVVAAIVIFFGAAAALRDKTWGVGVVLATSLAFPIAVMMGFAPPWFWLVGLVGVAPFVQTVKPMMRFDRGATVLFASIAGGTALASAFAWREAAIALFFALHR